DREYPEPAEGACYSGKYWHDGPAEEPASCDRRSFLCGRFVASYRHTGAWDHLSGVPVHELYDGAVHSAALAGGGDDVVYCPGVHSDPAGCRKVYVGKRKCDGAGAVFITKSHLY